MEKKKKRKKKQNLDILSLVESKQFTIGSNE